MVFELQALPGAAFAEHRRNAGHNRRGGQELPLPGDAEDAFGVGRFRMNCDSVAKLIPLYYYGELSSEEEDRRGGALSTSARPAPGRWSGNGQFAGGSTAERMEPPHRCWRTAARIWRRRLGRRAAQSAGFRSGPGRSFLEAAAALSRAPWYLYPVEAMAATWAASRVSGSR